MTIAVFFYFFFFSFSSVVLSHARQFPTKRFHLDQNLTSMFDTTSFSQHFSVVWGFDHSEVSENGMEVTLKLDSTSGFLGAASGDLYIIQTNIYGNGSTSTGREQRFFVDDIPIREVLKSEELGEDYPLKPMNVFATIWDASQWPQMVEDLK
ncbi:hypothetical protein SELMODRAFT_416664 [Selaginella moellendorffii]|uniref:GH16 domain-containing protein n=1 Tax=Selaginella moellendorffii TaxID=88036 RepID=D8S007_SELML|nr:hypothetical protein SELMODRAFT_416664 [Selaginella moellendorffii]